MIINKNKYFIRAVLFTLLFAGWAVLVMTSRLTGFDLAVQQFFISHRISFFNYVSIALEYVGHWPLPALVCAVLLIKKNTRFSYGLPLSVCVSCSVGMYELLKHCFKRPRPDSVLWLCNEHGYSFPSGHTLNNMVFWLAFASLLYRYFSTEGKSLPLYKKDRSTDFYPRTAKTMGILRILLIIWPVTIGLSRIYAAVHWPSDVVGSCILSVALLSIAELILLDSDAAKKG